MDLSTKFTGTYGTIYYVADMAKAVAYYKECFDLKPEDESAEWTTFPINGHKICLHATKDADQVGKSILVTSVKDLEEVVTTLKSRGVEFTQEITQVCEGGFAADYRDPSGAVVSLFEYKG